MQWTGLVGRTNIFVSPIIQNEECGVPPDLSRQSHAEAWEDWWASCNHRDHSSGQTANTFKLLLKIGKSCRECLAVMLYGCL